MERGREGLALLRAADGHWRFKVRDSAVDADGAAVFGVLGGTFPKGEQEAELYDGRRVFLLASVTLELAAEGVPDEVCLRLDGVPVDRVRAGGVLYRADCGARVH